jgi:hypothetical protein
MSEETIATDRYLAEIDRLLGLHGRERRRTLAMVRRRLSAFEADERKRGASDTETEKRALARLGKPKQVAQELRERALAQRARVNAQAVMAALIPILLALAAIALVVLDVRRYREDGAITIPTSESIIGEEGFFRHFRALDLFLPPRYLTLKLVLSLSLVVAAIVLAEFALAFVHRRRRLSSGLTLAGGLALVTAVSLQIAFAFEWHRLHQGHDRWLLAAILAEVGAVLFLAVFLTRAAKAILLGRLAPLARAPIFVLLVIAPLLAVGAKSGFGSTNLCGLEGYCGMSPESTIGFTLNHEVNVYLPSGPARAKGAVALRGRRLAAVIETWRTPPTEQPPPPGPTDLVVLESRWLASQRGPCGAQQPGPNGDRLAPRTRNWCDVTDPSGYRGASWREAARFDAKKVRAVAIAYRSSGNLAVAYSKPGGVWLASAPLWRPRLLLSTSAVSVRLVSLDNDDLALAAIVIRSGGPRLELLRTYGNRWSRTISVAAQPGLSMTSSASQVALLFRDRGGRLVLERRTPTLALLGRKTFGLHARGALGNLPGNAIGLAVSTPLRKSVLFLRIFRIGRRGLDPLAQEQLLLPSHSAVIPVTTVTAPISDKAVNLRTEQLAGVIQTGRVVRALYGGHPYGHTVGHVAMSAWLSEGRLAFASDWPRWAALDGRQQETLSLGKVTARWTVFGLSLGQPPELQLEALEAKR